MLDRDAIKKGQSEMRNTLSLARALGDIQFATDYDTESQTLDARVFEFEINGRINLVALAQAFMRGAGIEPLSDVAALQIEVAELRAEVAELRSLMRLVPRIADESQERVSEMRRKAGFTPLSGRAPADRDRPVEPHPGFPGSD